MQNFQEKEADIRHRYNQVGALVVAVTMPLGSILDHFNYPGYVAQFFLLRLLGTLLMIGLFLFEDFFRRKIVAGSVLVTYTPISLICLMIALGNNPQSDYHEGLNLVLIGGGILLRWSRQEAMTATGFTVLTYLAAATYNNQMVLQNLGSNLFFLLVTGLLVSLGCHYYYRLRENDFVLRNQLEEQNQELLQLDTMKNQFLANVSHELRTPLTLILGPLETLSKARETLPAQAGKQLDVMKENGFRLLRLIDDLLDLMRMNLSNAEVRNRPMDYVSFLNSLLASIQQMATEKKVTLQFVHSTIPPRLLLDKQKLERILLNLLINAIKFTPAGGRVRISADYEDSMLITRVADNGVGMTEEEQARIFEAFWQADSSTTRQFKGAGIGLALVKGVVEVLQGNITVQSRKGEGSEFTIQLPAQAEATEPGESPEASANPESDDEDALQRISRLALLEGGASTMRKRQALSSPMISSGHTTNATLIIADDEPSMLEFMREALQLRFPAKQILAAQDGLEAYELTRQHHPDVLILDHMMPGLDGIQVCNRLKEEVTTRNIPILMVTAHADENTRLQCLEAGATDFLNKPFSVIEFEVRLQNILSMKSFEQELQRKNVRLERALQELKEYESQLVNHAKMASLGRMSAGLIHEINNPLNYSIVAARVLKEDLLNGSEENEVTEDLRDLIIDIEDGVTRVSNIISDLRVFTHDKKMVDNEVYLGEVVNQAKRIVTHQLNTQEVEWESTVPDDLEIMGNQNQLVQVFVNLAQNSIDALATVERDPRKIRITALREDGAVNLIFEDNGPGIADAILPQIFEPFYSNKEVGEGMGLGLSICYNIIKAHGGSINVESEEGEFCRFLLNFPTT